MDPIYLLLIGIVIVIGGILVFRLHAFLALTLAGLAVAMLTPMENLQRFAEYERHKEKGGWSREEANDFLAAAKKDSGAKRFAGQLGETAGKIAILIAMAAIIGKCLLDSGAADRIVRTALGLVGEKRAPVAFIGSGFLLGIPVFFDTVFYLMIPLGKALRLRTGGNYTLYILSIVAGATMAHSLVPPTPGPLFVAEELGVNLGTMMVAGILVGLVTASVGYAWAVFANHLWQVPLRETADASLKDLEQLAKKPDSELPPLLVSILPILLPVILIAGATGVDTYVKAEKKQRRQAIAATPENAGLEDKKIDDKLEASLNATPILPPRVVSTVATLGDKNIALTLAAAIALFTLAWQKRTSLTELSTATGTALASGGVIILITSAGGGFGGVLRQTAIAPRIEELARASGMLHSLWLLPMAFGVTTLVRTAQGSATVAMITAVSILASFANDPAAMGFHPVYIALAIGCGSKPIAWMNDSGFWVICKMSGMTDVEGLKLVTPMSAAMGVVGLAAVVLGAWLFPLV